MAHSLNKSATQSLRAHVFCVVAMILSTCPLTAQAQIAEKQKLFEQQIKPVLKKYCYDCHGAKDAEGDFNLEAFKNANLILEQHLIWKKLAQRVSFGDMPPEEADELPDTERKQLLAAIDEMINKIDCTEQQNPGYVTIRRLNRFEYRNTVRDLLNVDYEPATDFPGDDTGYGFDNIGDVLSLPPLLMEKYLAAAEEISDQAIPRFADPSGKYKWKVQVPGIEFSGDRNSASKRSDAYILFSNGKLTKRITVPVDGKYSLNFTAFGDLAGDELPRMSILIDGKEIETVEIGKRSSDPQKVTFELKLAAGGHVVDVAFLNDYYNPRKKGNDRDRNLALVGFRAFGPTDVASATSESDLIFVRPSNKLKVEEAAKKVLWRLTSRAFRRPARSDEVERLQKLFQMRIKEGGSFDDGIRLALQAILVSPNFLFKVEQPPEGNAIRELDRFELTTSLSYFLWSSMPDIELLQLSLKNELNKGDNLEKQVTRMLKDEKSSALIENFGMQWLQIRSLEDMTPDEKRFPMFDEKMRNAMQTETRLLLKEIIEKDMSVLTLLTSDFTFVNQRLANHYGIENIKGEQFRKVSLNGTPRRGVLSHGSILTLTSNPRRTSPVKRGKWILENLLGTPPPPPAPDVMPLDEQEFTGTLREQMKQHRSNPACASCHLEMDALGFALENFDAVGGWRTKDAGADIDAKGVLPDGTEFDGPTELLSMLARQRKKEFARCFAEKMLTYALGRGLTYFDQCAVEEIVTKADKEDYRFSAFVMAVINSYPFRHRRNRGAE